jgi:hypothetical protein
MPFTRKEVNEIYNGKGFECVPLQAGSKKPNFPGWNKGNIPDYEFESDGNIGVILGDKSGGLVDADCDVPEAIKAAA